MKTYSAGNFPGAIDGNSPGEFDAEFSGWVGLAPRSRPERKTHCTHQDLGPENWGINSQGNRWCRACDREAHLRWKAKRSAKGKK